MRSRLRGGIALGSMYLICSAGLGKANDAVLDTLAAWVRELDDPFRIGGDAQVDPTILVQSGWLNVLGVGVVAPKVPTCGAASLDYSIIDKKAARQGDGH